ncbi:LPS assembly protein LptD [Permianibacter sp. IMCC34836]|uniref:LPS-assembly protein LptD n=1 Tax=Permianibacter fluminis TaxID=2738515 RepID=UPI001551BDB8|nr:LPS assembly protein LptD [Permianibacter fluminis]NQD36279.1 LPS assembly protein LptD [Permianibacter fluminis]
MPRRHPIACALALVLFGVVHPAVADSSTEAATETATETGTERKAPDANRSDSGFIQASCPVGKPLARQTEASQDLLSEPLNAKADWTENRSENETLLHGNVQLQHGSRSLRADDARLDNGSSQMEATGNVVLTDRNIEMRGSSLSADMNRESATVRDTEYRLTDRGMHGSASEFAVREDGFITLKDATFTSCPEGDESWLLSADEMALDRTEGWGEAWNMSIDLFGVPAVYLPWLTFPIDDRRRSGLLMPTFSNDQENGLDIALPYYLNLAENYDATLTPRWIENRGFQLGSELRYLTEASTGKIYAEGLANDRNASQEKATDRWAYDVDHRTQISPHLYGLIKAAGVSDDDYFQDLGRNVAVANANTLTRTGVLGYRDQYWQMSLQAYRAQVLQTASADEPYRKLPELRFLGQFPRLLGPLAFSVEGSATRFDHPDPSRDLADRSDIAPQLKLPMETMWGYLTPAVKYRYSKYELTNQLTDDVTTVKRELPIYSLDTGLFFERELQAFDRDLVQTVEPRIYGLYVPYKDQDAIPLFDTTEPTPSFNQLFRDNRFVGTDRQGDTRQVSVGLTTRFLSADGGDELLRLSLGQARYQHDREVTLLAGEPADTSDRSPVFGEAAIRLNQKLELRGLTGWDDQKNNTVRGSFALHYEPDERRVVNIEHRYREYRDRNAEQTDFSFAWPLSGNWQMVGRWQHDLAEATDIDSFLGFEYESCCWAVRLVGRRYLNVELDNEGNIIGDANEYDNSVYFQFVFKGLGGAGSNSLRSLLTESIDGYEDRLSPR